MVGRTLEALSPAVEERLGLPSRLFGDRDWPEASREMSMICNGPGASVRCCQVERRLLYRYTEVGSGLLL